MQYTYIIMLNFYRGSPKLSKYNACCKRTPVALLLFPSPVCLSAGGALNVSGP